MLVYYINMKKIILFLVVLYIAPLAGGWFFYTKTIQTDLQDAKALEQSFTKVEQDLATQKAENELLKKKIADARVYASFLSIALCPVLESTDKEALCIKNNTEWFVQTIESGTSLPDQEAKDKMTTLVMSLTSKITPTAKQIYETLKPVEVRALKMLTESLR